MTKISKLIVGTAKSQGSQNPSEPSECSLICKMGVVWSFNEIMHIKT